MRCDNLKIVCILHLVDRHVDEFRSDRDVNFVDMPVYPVNLVEILQKRAGCTRSSPPVVAGKHDAPEHNEINQPGRD